MMRTILTAGFLAAFIAAGACGGSDDDDDSTGPGVTGGDTIQFSLTGGVPTASTS